MRNYANIGYFIVYSEPLQEESQEPSETFNIIRIRSGFQEGPFPTHGKKRKNYVPFSQEFALKEVVLKGPPCTWKIQVLLNYHCKSPQEDWP